MITTLLLIIVVVMIVLLLAGVSLSQRAIDIIQFIILALFLLSQSSWISGYHWH